MSRHDNAAARLRSQGLYGFKLSRTAPYEDATAALFPTSSELLLGSATENIACPDSAKECMPRDFEKNNDTQAMYARGDVEGIGPIHLFVTENCTNMNVRTRSQRTSLHLKLYSGY